MTSQGVPSHIADYMEIAARQSAEGGLSLEKQSKELASAILFGDPFVLPDQMQANIITNLICAEVGVPDPTDKNKITYILPGLIQDPESMQEIYDACVILITHLLSDIGFLDLLQGAQINHMFINLNIGEKLIDRIMR